MTNTVVTPELQLDPADLVAQLLADLGVQRGQRLVEQQHPRLDRQRPGQRDPLLLAAGELVRVLRAVLGQADQVEQFAGPLVPLDRPRPRIRSPKPTLSSAVMVGNRL